jgi:hypothetical protein
MMAGDVKKQVLIQRTSNKGQIILLNRLKTHDFYPFLSLIGWKQKKINSQYKMPSNPKSSKISESIVRHIIIQFFTQNFYFYLSKHPQLWKTKKSLIKL